MFLLENGIFQAFESWNMRFLNIWNILNIEMRLPQVKNKNLLRFFAKNEKCKEMASIKVTKLIPCWAKDIEEETLL